MSTRLSHLQITDATDWKGLTTENHLGAMWKLEPQKVNDIIHKVLEREYGTNIDSLLNTFPALKMDTDDDFTWSLMSKALDNIPLVEARINGTAITAADECGVAHTLFELVFPKNYFSDTEVIVGEKNEIYLIRIVEEPVQEGTNWVYTCELMTGDANAFVPFDELIPGRLFSGEYSPVERGRHRKGREVRFKSMFEMRNGFTHLRMKHEGEGNMVYRKMGVACADENGKPIKMWIQYEMMKFKQEFREDINRCYMFGRSNRAQDGTYKQKGISGEVIRMGAGIREQMETANTTYFNNFSITAFSSRLMDLSEGKLNSDERNFVARTGERGSYQFHKSLEANTQLYTLNQTSNRIYPVSQKGFQMGMGYGGQFVEYKGPNNQIIKLSVDSMYDDKNRNKAIHPLGGVVESYRFDLMDFGSTDGQPNIQKVTVTDFGMVHKYEEGFMSPFTPVTQSSAISSPVNAWTEHLFDRVAAIVRDPSRTMAYKPNLLAS